MLFQGPIVKSDGIRIAVILESKGKPLTIKLSPFFSSRADAITFLSARDVIHLGMELRAVKVNRDATLQQIRLVAANGVVIVFAIFVVRE